MYYSKATTFSKCRALMKIMNTVSPAAPRVTDNGAGRARERVSRALINSLPRAFVCSFRSYQLLLSLITFHVNKDLYYEMVEYFPPVVSEWNEAGILSRSDIESVFSHDRWQSESPNNGLFAMLFRSNLLCWQMIVEYQVIIVSSWRTIVLCYDYLSHRQIDWEC